MIRSVALAAALALGIAPALAAGPSVRDYQAAVALSLSDPDAAHFRDLRTVTNDDGSVGLCGLLNAKNGFGAYGGFGNFYAAFTKDKKGRLVAETWLEVRHGGHRYPYEIAEKCEPIATRKAYTDSVNASLAKAQDGAPRR